jgi:hypothetical protein
MVLAVSGLYKMSIELVRFCGSRTLSGVWPCKEVSEMLLQWASSTHAKSTQAGGPLACHYANLCHILHSVSHWPVLKYLINNYSGVLIIHSFIHSFIHSSTQAYSGWVDI